MSKYFAKSNIIHNGVTYVRGDEISVSGTDAEVLLRDGIISGDKVEAVIPEDVKEKAAKAEKKAKEKVHNELKENEPEGGADKPIAPDNSGSDTGLQDTGEPSIDPSVGL